jgi:hypothetical protein
MSRGASIDPSIAAEPATATGPLIDYVITKFPFRIREVRTDNGHEFQAKFHWHVEDQGIRHARVLPAICAIDCNVVRYLPSADDK